MTRSTQRTSQRTLQSLLLKRFGMAVASYALVFVVCLVGGYNGLFNGTPVLYLLLIGVIVLSQALFFWLFVSARNLRFRDPSLTEAQVLIALTWLGALLCLLDEGRGTLLALYVLVMLFGVFQLRPRVFARCALYAFCSFSAINLYEAYTYTLRSPALAAMQVFTLAVLLLWLCLFANYMQAMRQRMRQRRFALQAHQDTLRGMMRQLEDLVATDELTGLCNRRHFLHLATRALEGLKPGSRLGLALIDLDHFKRINDVHGHAAGDRVLQMFAGVARACLRDGDTIARYGGEEFVLLLPNTDGDQVASCCERLREAFAQAEPIGIKVDNLSLSIGMTLMTSNDNLDDALQRADQALYQAKRGGRNRCAAAWEDSGA
ncbi:MAG: GGDEF domain-containing protein [Gammaproteobacteria bacterium]|nr:GGDEF domain-containing protein [Gammaproteobacteria bacterium]MBU1488822.1 GGDEF domain-containing protein [Gammaproteobacteria bacterium]MBU2218086.1 GGDEF domain-containing protein [Gammaproteobacteria bacterium]MBU2323217.1 GGDEF domain-containing protein [Gammaproteobacteria bacterium]